MRVVVTGATGNVGTSVLAALAEEPAVREIVGVARRKPAALGAKTEFATADVSRDNLDPIFAGADAVVHLAWVIQPAREKRLRWVNNVDGTRRVFQSAMRAGVPTIVHASSVGAYTPASKDRRVGESWPTQGVSGATYSIEKAAVETLIDRFELDHPTIRVVRLRPALIFKREAAAGIRKLFVGPLAPNLLFRHLPLVPEVPDLVIQAVHSYDVADAYRRVLLSDVRGAFNIAAEPLLDAQAMAEALDARRVPFSKALLRAGARVGCSLRLDRAGPEWVEMALRSPLLDCTRARIELGWAPRHTSVEALRDLVRGLGEDAGLPTPPLTPRHGRIGGQPRPVPWI